MTFFHSLETPNLKDNFFIEKKKLIKFLPKTLIISGGSRNGNHLMSEDVMLKFISAPARLVMA